MGKVFGAIFSLFGSLFGVIGKLFGFKKSGYYLELVEEGSEQSASPTQAAVATPSVEATPKSAPAKKTKAKKTTTAQVAPAESPVVQEAAVSSPSVAEEAAVSSPSPDVSEVAQVETAAPVPQVSVTDPLELIRAALSNSGTASGGDNGAVTEGNFATDYLVLPSGSGRRRPGPSLSPFKDMAKGMRR
ncbi:MAG: hypothetical protein AAFV72_17865 [Cyanobacteria bacterium J06635_1]